MSQKEREMASGESSGDQNPPILPPYYQYGTFQGVAYHTSARPPLPPHHIVGIRHPSPYPTSDPSAPYHYAHGYQAVPGYAVVEGTPIRDPSLPCCGLGIGWLLFLAGFFLAAIPWYVGAMILLCVRMDYKEKPGLVACMIASILTMIAVVFGVTKGADAW
ncbi:hypothetical protein V2J09_019286 [Rumex salicifolius]